jgi:hypothetical protein
MTGDTDDTDPELLKVVPKGTKPILYTSAEETIPRDVLYGYLTTCSKMMVSESCVNLIVDVSLESRLALPLSAMGFQRDVLEFNFQIERNFGCQYLSAVSQKHPQDTELLEAAKSFMFTAMRSYLIALKLRKKRYDAHPELAPRGRRFDRIDMLEFFEGCNCLSKPLLVLSICFAVPTRCIIFIAI